MATDYSLTSSCTSPPYDNGLEPELESDTEYELKHGPEPDPGPEPGTEPEPETEPGPEPKPKPKPEPDWRWDEENLICVNLSSQLPLFSLARCPGHFPLNKLDLSTNIICPTCNSTIV